jgi:hypothetical protein
VLALVFNLGVWHYAGSQRALEFFTGYLIEKSLSVDNVFVFALFLLEMGLVAGRRLGDLRKVGPFLLAFGIMMPVLHGCLGVWLGKLTGLELGGATLLGVLAASASYIAAPAAIRMTLPDANPTFYLTSSLAVTFPFNIARGIPIYFEVARRLYS